MPSKSCVLNYALVEIWQPGTFLDMTADVIKYSDFVNKELILFSMADLSRSIPSMVDGLKPGQRKILFCSFKRNFVTQAKVCRTSHLFVFYCVVPGSSLLFQIVHNTYTQKLFLQKSRLTLLAVHVWSGCSILRIRVRAFGLPSRRTEFGKYHHWNGSKLRGKQQH